MEHVSIRASHGASGRLSHARRAAFGSLQRPANRRSRRCEIRMRRRESEEQRRPLYRCRVRLHRRQRLRPCRRRRPHYIPTPSIQIVPNRGRRQHCRATSVGGTRHAAVVKAVGKIIPQSSGGTMEQQLGQLAAQTAAVAPESRRSSGRVGTGPAPAGQPSGSETQAAPDSELTWRADRPPAVWPALPSGQCLAKSTQERTAAEALALAKEIEARWDQSKALEAPTKRVSSEEIKKARCALLAIDPADKEYPQAWAAFVRLGNIDRELAG